MSDEATPSRVQALRRRAALHGLDVDAALQIGGNYASSTEHGGLVHVSGQVPRVGGALVRTGRVGEAVTLAQAREAAEVCVLRVLTVLHQAHGLERVRQVLKMNVFVQSGAGFTQHSEVADAASDLLVDVLGPQCLSARTSVGVQQLPKDAPVEIDAIVGLTAPIEAEAIAYRHNLPLAAHAVARVFDASGIRRPTGDLPRIARMFAAPGIHTVSAWRGDALVGVCRALTDHSYCCYLSDLAVDRALQGQGIGRRLIQELRDVLSDEVSLILLSAPGAMSYYPDVGFSVVDNGFMIKRTR